MPQVTLFMRFCHVVKRIDNCILTRLMRCLFPCTCICTHFFSLAQTHFANCVTNTWYDHCLRYYIKEVFNFTLFFIFIWRFHKAKFVNVWKFTSCKTHQGRIRRICFFYIQFLGPVYLLPTNRPLVLPLPDIHSYAHKTFWPLFWRCTHLPFWGRKPVAF